MILDTFRSSRGLRAAIALAQAGANVGCHGRNADGKATSETVRQLGRTMFSPETSDADVYPALI